MFHRINLYRQTLIYIVFLNLYYNRNKIDNSLIHTETSSGTDCSVKRASGLYIFCLKLKYTCRNTLFLIYIGLYISLYHTTVSYTHLDVYKRQRLILVALQQRSVAQLQLDYLELELYTMCLNCLYPFWKILQRILSQIVAMDVT